MKGRDIAIIIGIVVLVILAIGLVGGGMMGWGMMGYYGPGVVGYGRGWGIAMGIAMVIFWVLIIGGIVWLVATLSRPSRPGETGIWTPRPHALDILQERYAKGEITQEQYEQMRRVIEGK